MDPITRPISLFPHVSWHSIAHQARYSVAGLEKIYGEKRLWLWRLWKKECGCSPKVWLAGKRIESARLMAARGVPAQVIANSLFYADASHLIREFHRATGQTIGGYRRMVRPVVRWMFIRHRATLPQEWVSREGAKQVE